MDTIALILSIIGSLNWGLVSLFKFDLVAWIFGGQAAVLSRIIYGLVGLAGLWCSAADIEISVKNHLIGFAAEKARHNNTVEDIDEYMKLFNMEND